MDILRQADISRDVAAIGKIEGINTILKVLIQSTGLRIALVARVTTGSWAACAVLDEANFGLQTGNTLDVATTF